DLRLGDRAAPEVDRGPGVRRGWWRRNGRVPVAWPGPGVHAAREIEQPGEAVLRQDLARLRAAPARRTDHEDRAVPRRQLANTVVELVERDRVRTRDVAGVELGRRAHVEDEEVGVLLREDHGRG